MWIAVVAFVKRHPALCAIGALVLMMLGYRSQAKKAKAQRDRARYDIKDVRHEERIKQAQARAEEAKRKGDAIAEHRAEIDKEHEELLRNEETRHRDAVERIEKDRDDTSDIDFIGERIKRGAARSKKGRRGSSGRSVPDDPGGS